MISTIVTFLIILGVLVFIHEFGHFIVARLSGVGVLTFSLGFGPKLVSRKIGGTEYCISAVPLGGYVRLLGDDPKEEISPEEAHRSFLAQGFGKKVAIVAAGPIFNLLLAFVVFSIFFMVGVPSLSSDVGEVLENSAAARAGIRPDDRVAAINGKKVDYWDQIEEAVQKSNGRALQITVSRDGKEITTEVIPMVQEEKDIFGDPVKIWEVGLQPKVPAKIGSIQSGSPADSAGIKPGDQIIAVGDKKITQWQQIRDEIQASKGEEITLHVLRDGKQIELKITPKSADVQEPKG